MYDAAEEYKRFKITRAERHGQEIEWHGQHRQDIFVHDVFFEGKRGGTFFECGGLDGIYLSNTYVFERYFGWKGVLLEPLTAQFEKLKDNRPNSVCYNACVGPKEETVLFFNHKGGGLSGIVKEVGRTHIERLEYSYAHAPHAYQRNPDLLRLEWKPVMVTTRAITEAGFSHIDFFSLDVEGGEFAVLSGLDLDVVTVDLFCIEVNAQSKGEVDEMLTAKDYQLIASVGQDRLYGRRTFIEGLLDSGVDLNARLLAAKDACQPVGIKILAEFPRPGHVRSLEPDEAVGSA